ncbi:unnamed protein product [Sphagnum balticum]
MANFEGGTSVQYADKVAGDLNSASDRASLSRGVSEAAGIFDQSNGAWATARQELTASVDLKQFGLEGFQIVGANDSNPSDPVLDMSNGRQNVTLDAQGHIADAQTPSQTDNTYQPLTPGMPENLTPPPEIAPYPQVPGFQPDAPQYPQDGGYFPPTPNDGPQMPYMPTIPTYPPPYAQYETPQTPYEQSPLLDIPPLANLLGLTPNYETPTPGYDPSFQPYGPSQGFFPQPGGPMDGQYPQNGQYPQDNSSLGPLSLLNPFQNPLQNFDQPDYPQDNGGGQYQPYNNYSPQTDDGSDSSGDGDDSY